MYEKQRIKYLLDTSEMVKYFHMFQMHEDIIFEKKKMFAMTSTLRMQSRYTKS